MRRSLKAALSAVVVAAPMVLVAGQFGSSVAAPTAQGPDHYTPHNATIKIAGLQHWCGTNGITCAEPATNWSELHGYKAAVKAGAHIYGYIGHDEPDATFLSGAPGSGGNVTWTETLGRDPRGTPGNSHPGSDLSKWFELSPAPWFSMALCDPNSFPGTACTPNSDSNAPTCLGLNCGPTTQGGGSAFMEMQLYPPGNAPFADSESCDARHWCAALNVDSFTGTPTTNANPACVEPVNFAFIQKDGVPTGEYEDFATGFVIDDRELWGRPVGVAVDNDGALLLSEDAGGTIWRITYSGNAAQAR